jgi:hypothetical protein
MTNSVTHETKDTRWRTILFVVVAALVALLYGSAIRFLAAPWVPVGDPGIQTPEIHRWHFALTGGITSMLGLSILALSWRPRRKPLLVQYAAVAAVVGVLLNAPFVGPFMFVVAAPIVLLVAAYPAPRALLDFSREGPISRPLLILTLVAGVLLAPTLWQLLLWQIQGAGGEHAATNQWIADAEHTVLLLLAGLASSTKRPGWRTLGVLTGVAFLYLGVAALMLPDQAGSWGVIGGILALLAGAGYIAATLLEAHGAARAPVRGGAGIT